ETTRFEGLRLRHFESQLDQYHLDTCPKTTSLHQSTSRTLRLYFSFHDHLRTRSHPSFQRNPFCQIKKAYSVASEPVPVNVGRSTSWKTHLGGNSSQNSVRSSVA